MAAAIEKLTTERDRLRAEAKMFVTEVATLLADRQRLRAWLRRACNELDAVGSEHAKQWAAAIRIEAEIAAPEERS